MITNEPYDMTHEEKLDYDIGRFVELTRDYAEIYERDGDIEDAASATAIADKWEAYLITGELREV
jgi:hypothetical protein